MESGCQSQQNIRPLLESETFWNKKTFLNCEERTSCLVLVSSKRDVWCLRAQFFRDDHFGLVFSWPWTSPGLLVWYFGARHRRGRTGGQRGTNRWEVHSNEAEPSELLVFWWKLHMAKPRVILVQPAANLMTLSTRGHQILGANIAGILG